MNRKTSFVGECQVLSDVKDLGNTTFGTIEIRAMWLNWFTMLDIKDFDTRVVQRGP